MGSELERSPVGQLANFPQFSHHFPSPHFPTISHHSPTAGLRPCLELSAQPHLRLLPGQKLGLGLGLELRLLTAELGLRLLELGLKLRPLELAAQPPLRLLSGLRRRSTIPTPIRRLHCRSTLPSPTPRPTTMLRPPPTARPFVPKKEQSLNQGSYGRPERKKNRGAGTQYFSGRGAPPKKQGRGDPVP